jgi:hypothetical protein
MPEITLGFRQLLYSVVCVQSNIFVRNWKAGNALASWYVGGMENDSAERILSDWNGRQSDPSLVFDNMDDLYRHLVLRGKARGRGIKKVQEDIVLEQGITLRIKSYKAKSRGTGLQ